MTKEEFIKEIEESIQDIDKCISEDEEYIRGWKCAMLTILEKLKDYKESWAMVTTDIKSYYDWERKKKKNDENNDIKSNSL